MEIQLLIECFINYFTGACYSSNRIETYKSLWRNGIVKYMLQNCQVVYTPSVGAAFVDECVSKKDLGPVGREKIRSIQVLDDFLNLGYIRKNTVVLVRLLYSTGLRISEALSLRNGDVNLNESYIIIRKSKNGDERIVPLEDTMKSVLLQYLSYRDRMPIAGLSNPDSFLFVKMDSTPCACGTIYTWFKRILYQCGIPHLGNHRGPRVHDIRYPNKNEIQTLMIVI